jgi:hypothetical protein
LIPTERQEPSETGHDDEKPQRRRRTFAARLRAYAISTACISAILFAIFHRPLFFENLTPIDDRVVRSAQPGENLDDWIQKYQLASILNLRGGTPADPWYKDEVKTAKSHNVEFYDYPMIATRRPLRRDLLTLIDFMRSSPFPLLIHCKHGADRTGLAVAIYRMVCLNEPPDRAKQAFSIFHGHIPIAGTQRLHDPLDEYEAWLDEQKLPHTPDRFRGWVKDFYQANDPSTDPRPLASGPRPLARR